MDSNWSGQYWERFFREVEAPSLLRPEKLPEVDVEKVHHRHVEVSTALMDHVDSVTGGDPKGRFAIAYAALVLLMEVYTQRKDIPVATPLFSGSEIDSQGEAFLFLNVRFREELVARELIILGQKAIDTARHHQQQVPWRNGEPQVDGAYEPLVAISDYKVNPQKGLPLGGQLLFSVEEGAGKEGWGLSVIALDVFHPDLVMNLGRHWRAALEFITGDFEREVSGFSCFDENDLQQLRSYSHGESVALPSTRNLYSHFRLHADQEPKMRAVVCGGKELSYEALNQGVLRLASGLRTGFNITSGSTVAVSLPSGFDLPTVYLALLCLGATIVPVEPSLPDQRKLHYVKASQSELFITETRLQEWTGNQVSPMEVRDYGSDDSKHLLAHETQPEDIAFILYTSGSTGLPKGACITSSSILSIVIWYARYFSFDSEDVLPQKTTINFVDSLVEMLVPLTFGHGTVYLRPTDDVIHDDEQFFEWLRQIQPTMIQAVPSVYESMRQGAELEKLGSLKALIFSGEQLKKAYHHSFPIHNLYGASEFGGHSHFKCLTAETIEQFGSIGKLIQNVSCYILDAKGRMCPPFVQGELFIGGSHVVSGYRNQPELTKAKFVPNPFVAGEMLYNTEDLGAWTSDGEVEFHGRKDFQVKVRGVRIELGEIEIALLRHPSVDEAVVVHSSDDDQGKLTAYFTGKEVAVTELYQWLENWLPTAFIPSGIYRLDSMPKNVSGKVDRNALPDPKELQKERIFKINAPQTPLEVKLTAIWNRVLSIEVVDVEASIYEQGIHSLNVVRLANQIGIETGKEVPGRMLYKHSSIRQLATFLENDQGKDRVDIADFKSSSKRRYPLAPGQRQIWLHHQLHPETPNNISLACTVEGQVSIDHLERVVTEIVQRHEVLRTRIQDVDGDPTQEVYEAEPFKVGTIEVSDDGMEEALFQIVNSRFDLSTDRLFSVHVIRQGEGETAVILVFHHVISDGWSVENFVRELIAGYHASADGADISLASLPFQYKEFALWHHDWLQTNGQVAQQYWHQKLAGDLAAADLLPLDFPWANARKQPAASQKVELSSASLSALHQLSLDHECTLFHVMLTSILTLLSSYGEDGDMLSIGMPVAGRQQPGLENQLGFYANPVVINQRMDHQGSYSSFLQSLKSSILEATQYQLYPFDQLVSELGVERQTGRHPFFDVMVAWNQVEGIDFSLDSNVGNGQWKRWPMPLPEVAKHALTFTFYSGDGRLDMLLTYDSGLFEEDTIKLLLHRWTRLLEQMTGDLPETLGGVIGEFRRGKPQVSQIDDFG